MQTRHAKYEIFIMIHRSTQTYHAYCISVVPKALCIHMQYAGNWIHLSGCVCETQRVCGSMCARINDYMDFSVAAVMAV